MGDEERPSRKEKAADENNGFDSAGELCIGEIRNNSVPHDKVEECQQAKNKISVAILKMFARLSHSGLP